MKKLILILLVFLTGCTSVPVKQTFPLPVASTMYGCPNLTEVIEGTTKLSEVLLVVTNNYAEYQLCQSKVDAWIDWYNKQQKIYNSK